MQDGVFEHDLNIERLPSKGGRGRFETANVRAYAIGDGRWMYVACSKQRRTFQVERVFREACVTGTRTISTTADVPRCVDAPAYIARGHLVNDVIDVFLTTTASQARRRGAENGHKFHQSSRIADVYLEPIRDLVIVVSGRKLAKVSQVKRENSVTSRNIDCRSENRFHFAIEVIDPDAAGKFFRILVCTDDQRREPFGPVSPLALRSPLLPDSSAWLPATWLLLHHRTPAFARPLMRVHLESGLREKTPHVMPCRESRLKESPAPVRRYDQAPLSVAHVWRRVGTQVPSGVAVARVRCIRGVFKSRGLRGRHAGLIAKRPPGARRGTPRTGFDVKWRAPRRPTPVLPDRDEKDVMRLRPPTPRHTIAWRQGQFVRVRADMAATSNACTRPRCPGGVFPGPHLHSEGVRGDWRVVAGCDSGGRQGAGLQLNAVSPFISQRAFRGTTAGSFWQLLGGVVPARSSHWATWWLATEVLQPYSSIGDAEVDVEIREPTGCLEGAMELPRALAAPQPKVPAGPQYMSIPSSAAVVVIIGVIVVLGRGETGYDVTGQAPIPQFLVLADRKSTGVMRLRPPTPRRTTARRKC
ncbi:hypothetical protein MRX96_046082 [Rhipicephalus microplus]